MTEDSTTSSSQQIHLAKPHKNQEYILRNKKRFNIVKTGRRFGKTEIVKLLSSYALQGKFVGIWFPTYKDLADIWRELVVTFYPAIISKNEQVKQILFVNGGLIDFWSMDDPDAGRGRKYHRVIADEFAKAKKAKQAWQGTIRPTLTDYMGDGWFFSTPKGKNNYFYELEQEMKKQADWACFKFTSYDNPYLNPLEIDDARNQLDKITFEQEYLAEDVDANDRPFLYKFDESIHCIDLYKPNPHLPILASFDFNKDPMTCLIGQQVDIWTSYAFAEINIANGSTPEVCDEIIVNYPKWYGNTDVSGDATGRNRSALTVGNLNHYRIIKDKLDLQDDNLKMPKQNPALSDSRVLCNSVLQNAKFYITRNCKKTIRDAGMAYVDASGELVKTQVEGLHHFDTLRYMLHAFYPDFVRHPERYTPED